MALLNDPDPRQPVLRVLTVTLALLAAGCAIGTWFDGSEEEQRLAFSHRIHTDEGLECGDCHMGADSSDEPGMPTLDGCRLCHEETEEPDPEQTDIAQLFDAEGKVAARYTPIPDENVFSHLRHVEAGVECSACHGEIETTDAVDPGVGLTMAECMDCHQQRSVTNECSTCHSEIDKDSPPYTHLENWRKVHGRVFRSHSEALVDNCSLCHTEATCTTCHADEQPESHNNYFRLRGHGAFASMDRESCAACHRTDFCVRCHSETQPQSHTGSWGGTQSNHCLSCHTPLNTTGCFTCHKATPSHQMAPPKPPDHVPSMNCRLCHGMGLPLPHADNGSDCNSCHR